MKNNRDNKEAAVSMEKKANRTIAGIAKGLGNAVATAKTTAEKAKDTISNAVDITGDGRIDAEDFSKLAEAAGKGIKRGGELLSTAAAEIKLASDLKQLRPVFPADLLVLTAGPSAVSPMQIITRPGMVRIVDRDKKRDENEACAGAIGYWTLVKGMEILNIYEDRTQETDMRFYPNAGKSFYYADPCQPNLYIALDEYFAYMKKARVSELEMVAKDLGAKKFSIVFKELKKTFVSKSAKSNVKATGIKGEASYDRQNSDVVSTSIVSQAEFTGHDNPIQPQLIYFKNESDIEKLIEMRMGDPKGNQLRSKTYSIQYSKTAGIKEKEAVAIDATLS